MKRLSKPHDVRQLLINFKTNYFPFYQDFQRRLEEAGLFTLAASLSYTTLLSIVPFLAVSFSIFQVFGGMDRLYNLAEPFIMSHLAAGTGQEVTAFLQQSIGRAQTTAIGIGGLVGLVVTSMSLLYSIEKAIHQIWKIPMQKKVLSRLPKYWLFITWGPLALSIVIGAVVSNENIPITRLIPSQLAFLIVSVSGFFCLYKFVPEVSVRWQCAMVAAIITALLWTVVQDAYGLYAKTFMAYHTLYGSLGAVPVMLVWLYVVWVIVLTGAAISASLQNWLGPDFHLNKPRRPAPAKSPG